MSEPHPSPFGDRVSVKAGPEGIVSEPTTDAGKQMLASEHHDIGKRCYDSPRCGHGRYIAEIERQAADAARDRQGLDVERLARAMRTIGGPPMHMDMWREEAERIAAEYARLGSAAEEEG